MKSMFGSLRTAGHTGHLQVMKLQVQILSDGSLNGCLHGCCNKPPLLGPLWFMVGIKAEVCLHLVICPQNIVVFRRNLMSWEELMSSPPACSADMGHKLKLETIKLVWCREDSTWRERRQKGVGWAGGEEGGGQQHTPSSMFIIKREFVKETRTPSSSPGLASTWSSQSGVCVPGMRAASSWSGAVWHIFPPGCSRTETALRITAAASTLFLNMGSHCREGLSWKSLLWCVLLLWLCTYVNGTWKTRLYKTFPGTQQSREAAARTPVYQKR